MWDFAAAAAATAAAALTAALTDAERRLVYAAAHVVRPLQIAANPVEIVVEEKERKLMIRTTNEKPRNFLTLPLNRIEF